MSIIDAASKHVELHPAGPCLKGLCPFHQEKTPSFVVNPQRGTFYCFGCHAHGNAADFEHMIANRSNP